MKVLRLAPAFVVAFVLILPNQSSAQASQLADWRWNWYSVVLPYGLDFREVVDGGSYVILEDGSVWEIRLPQRPNASSWRPGDFVRLKTIAAPVDQFEILLAHDENDKAEARLVGRDRAPQSNLPQE